MPLLQITLIYLLVGAVGASTYLYLEGALWWRFLGADIAMTVVTYAFSVLKRNSSVYDAYWSVIPFYFVVGLALVTDVTSWSWPQWAYVVVVSTWSWRLTYNWARSWPGWHHEDWRYVNFRNQFGAAFQLVNFSGIHAYPTAIVFLSSVGMFWVAVPDTEIAWLHALGLVTASLGVWLEFVADNQLVAFRRAPERQKKDILQQGLWGMVRYPNYLGEILFWVGLVFCGFGAGAPPWTAAGATGMIIMFLFASIPMKEKRMLQRRPHFSEVQQRIPMLLPWKGLRPGAKT